MSRDVNNYISWVVLGWCFLIIGCKTAEKVGFDFDGRNVLVETEHNLQAISSEDFYLVADWSDDYTRKRHGTGQVKNGIFVFKGALNHSRDMCFIYDIRSRHLDGIANARKVIVDSKTRQWSAVVEPPLHAEDDGMLSIVVNNQVVGRVIREAYVDIQWADGSLVLRANTKGLSKSK